MKQLWEQSPWDDERLQDQRFLEGQSLGLLLAFIMLAVWIFSSCDAHAWGHYKKVQTQDTEEQAMQQAEVECEIMANAAASNAWGYGRIIKKKRMMKQCMASKGYEK